jgi:hypothetical protein
MQFDGMLDNAELFSILQKHVQWTSSKTLEILIKVYRFWTPDQKLCLKTSSAKDKYHPQDNTVD